MYRVSIISVKSPCVSVWDVCERCTRQMRSVLIIGCLESQCFAQIYKYLAVSTPTHYDTESCHMKSRIRNNIGSALICKHVTHWLLYADQHGFHKSGVPIVKAELPNPSSCFIVPLSMGQSLCSMPSQSAHGPSNSINQRKLATRTEDNEQVLGKEHHNELRDGTFCLF